MRNKSSAVMGRRRWTDLEDADLVTMVTRGKSYEKCAKKLKRTSTACCNRYSRLMSGMRPNRNVPIQLPMSYNGSDKKFKPWTASEDESLSSMRVAGFGWDFCAKSLGRTSGACRKRYGSLQAQAKDDLDNSRESDDRFKNNANGPWSSGEDLLLFKMRLAGLSHMICSTVLKRTKAATMKRLHLINSDELLSAKLLEDELDDELLESLPKFIRIKISNIDRSANSTITEIKQLPASGAGLSRDVSESRINKLEAENTELKNTIERILAEFGDANKSIDLKEELEAKIDSVLKDIRTSIANDANETRVMIHEVHSKLERLEKLWV